MAKSDEALLLRRMVRIDAGDCERVIEYRPGFLKSNLMLGSVGA